jgi:hypothetical protein
MKFAQAELKTFAKFAVMTRLKRQHGTQNVKTYNRTTHKNDLKTMSNTDPTKKQGVNSTTLIVLIIRLSN